MKKYNSTRKRFIYTFSILMLLSFHSLVFGSIRIEEESEIEKRNNVIMMDPLGERSLSSQPYWIKILSKGASYIPSDLRIDISSWSDKNKKRMAYQTLISSLELNTAVLSGKISQTIENMNFLINNNKQAQYFLESVQGKYIVAEGLPEITHKEDPLKARLFSDFSMMILEHIKEIAQSENFSGFTEFEIHFINASLDYLSRNIEIMEKALPIFSKDYETELITGLGYSYNSYGFALSLLGEVDNALTMYKKALLYLPDENDIKENIKSINESLSYLPRENQKIHTIH